MKDYYAILGVLPSIDQVALAAVYRALLKKYHPDVYVGSPRDAHKITQELNEAYEVLGDPKRRAAYDNARTTQSANSGDYDSQSANENSRTDTVDEAIERGWAFVVRYHPGAESERQALHNLSPNLAFQFQVVLLEGRNVQEFQAVSRKLKSEFLRRYFGTDENVHEYVVSALQQGRKDVALEVNRAIKVLGSPSAAKVPEFLNQVSSKCGWSGRAGWNQPAARQGASIEPSYWTTRVVLFLIIAVGLGLIFHSQTPSPRPPPPATVVPDPLQQLASPAPSPPVLPSFDCTKIKSDVLKLVCATPELATLDNQLAASYAAAMSKVPSPGVLRDDERAWIVARNNVPADAATLKQLYMDRISVLDAIAAKPMGYLSAGISAAANIDHLMVANAATLVVSALKEGGVLKIQADLKACYDAATQQTWMQCLAYDAAAENLLPGIEKAANLPPTEMFMASTFKARATEYLKMYGIRDTLEQEQVLQTLSQLSTGALSKAVSEK